MVLVGALGLSACAGKDKRPTIAYQERPVELLYNVAASVLDSGNWDLSILYFREVERQHPYSEWARRAILMGAYASYRSRDYNEAIRETERFVQLYPGNPSAAYAYYLKSVCYFERIVDVGRDQASTESAQAALREVVRRFPRSDYAADARLKLDMVDDQLAGKEMTVGRFYLRNGDTVAAIGRFRNVIDRYQTTSHTPEALFRLTEAYLTLGLVDEARRNSAVLGANFPGDIWYSDAYDLMTDRGSRPTVRPQPTSNQTPRLRNLFGILPGGQPASPALPPPAAGEPAPAPQAAPAAEAPAAAAPSSPPQRRLRNLFGVFGN